MEINYIIILLLLGIVKDRIKNKIEMNLNIKILV